MKNDGKAYPIPDDWDTSELYCFRVYVPRRALYLGAFWEAYQFFTRWLAWTQDALHTGQKVANLWRSAWDKARAEFDLTGGECMANITGIRADPLDPCTIQVQYDGGAWVDALDISCCGGGGGGGGGACPPLMRVVGGQMQAYNTGTKSWDNVGPVVDPIMSNPQQQIPEPTSQTACDAARNVALAQHQTKHDVLATLAVTQEAAVFGGQLVILLVPFQPELALAFGVIEICTLIIEALVPIEAEVEAADIRDDLTCLMTRYLNNDGTQTQQQYEDMKTALQARAAGASSDGERGAWNLAYWLSTLIGPTGINSMATNGTSSGYDCSTCEWEAVIDWEHNGPDGMIPTPHYDGTSWGTFIPGQGWATQLKNDTQGRLNNFMWVERPCLDFTMNDMTIVYSAHEGTPPDNAQCLLRICETDAFTLPGTVDHASLFRVFNNHPTNNKIVIEAETNKDDHAIPFAYWIVHKIIIHGTGAKP